MHKSDWASPSSLPATAPLVVCPECHYGFLDRQDASDDYVCPRPTCGHRWHAGTKALKAVHVAERRRAHPELRVVAGAGALELELPEGETLIGRAEECGFRLDNLSVSRRHARLTRNSDQTTVEDLGSSSGVYVNGQLVPGPSVLNPGDELVVGGVRLEFAVRFSAECPTATGLIDNAATIAHAAGAMPLVFGKPGDVIPLGNREITFGRAADRDVRFADAMISNRHAVLTRESDGYYLSDTQSLIGTYVNGRSVIRQRLEPGDRVQFGPYLFVVEAGRLVRLRQLVAFGVRAVHVTQTVGAVKLLDGVNLDLQPGQFVGLLGPSGAGKTTLLDALNGLRPAVAGRVLVNGLDLYEQYDLLRYQIGYVPQDDIIHRELTVRQALEFAGRLRLPADVARAELARWIDETLHTLDLERHVDVPIGRLSGGQRKRVSVGVELLSKPGILYLDEPTSGLDPATESRLMRKFRQLADQGRTVVCTTHVMENVDLFHQVAVLVPGGKLAYCGPPLEAKTYFGIEKFTLLYDRLEEKPPDEWRREFAASPRAALARAAAAPAAAAGGTGPRRAAAGVSSSFLRQWLVLTLRGLAVAAADKSNLALLMLQPLAITSLICVVCRGLPEVFFLLVISALWFGCSNAAQQLVKERPVYRRERLVNLRLDAYLASKFFPLAVIGGLQSALMLALVLLFKDSYSKDALGSSFAALFLAAMDGAAMGLIISALAATTDRAMSVVPLSLIPQIILAGVLVAIPEMNRPTRAASCLVAARWANEATDVSLFEGRPIDADLLSDSSRLRPLWNLYPDYDLFKPDSGRRFLADYHGQHVAKRSRLGLDVAVLCAFIAVELAVAAVILKKQDTI
jgi:ABC-type multidrug transport system ATPase subunit/pSer/pThr/pTyr-binding forkhead associated (FHA) protein